MVERYIEYIAFFGVSSTKMAEPFYHFGRAKMLLGLLSSIKRRSNTTVDHCTRPLTVVNPTKPKLTQQSRARQSKKEQNTARQSKAGQALQRGTATAAQAKSQSDTLYDISKPKAT